MVSDETEDCNTWDQWQGDFLKGLKSGTSSEADSCLKTVKALSPPVSGNRLFFKVGKRPFNRPILDRWLVGALDETRNALFQDRYIVKTLKKLFPQVL